MGRLKDTFSKRGTSNDGVVKNIWVVNFILMSDDLGPQHIIIQLISVDPSREEAEVEVP